MSSRFGFHHIALKCKDFEKSIAFYKAIGFTEYARWGSSEQEIILLKLPSGEGMFELFSDGGDMFPEEGKYVHIALASTDVVGDYERALCAGATPLTPPKTVPVDSCPVRLSLHLAFVKGPDGEQLEFIQSTEE
ncbi:MAG: VOC family protein [Clostridia bacterium]|nr:VOC family protein [Clostridia bacterium]